MDEKLILMMETYALMAFLRHGVTPDIQDVLCDGGGAVKPGALKAAIRACAMVAYRAGIEQASRAHPEIDRATRHARAAI